MTETDDMVTQAMRYPTGLHVIERPAAAPGAPTVILVHGSLDRAESFRRVMRRLPEFGIVAYDRRGYQESRKGGVVGLGGHVADLLDVASEVRAAGATTVVAVGHSLGGDVVVAAAVADPRALDSVGAFEPPMPWLGFRRPEADVPGPRRWRPLAEDPGDEAKQFFCRMVSPTAWQHLSDEGRASRRADGPALVADLTGIRGDAPFDLMALAVPATFGMGGLASAPHHREAVVWLGSHVPGAASYEIEGAKHGAHLSHPDHFADFIRAVVSQAAL